MVTLKLPMLPAATKLPEVSEPYSPASLPYMLRSQRDPMVAGGNYRIGSHVWCAVRVDINVHECGRCVEAARAGHPDIARFERRNVDRRIVSIGDSERISSAARTVHVRCRSDGCWRQQDPRNWHRRTVHASSPNPRRRSYLRPDRPRRPRGSFHVPAVEAPFNPDSADLGLNVPAKGAVPAEIAVAAESSNTGLCSGAVVCARSVISAVFRHDGRTTGSLRLTGSRR